MRTQNPLDIGTKYHFADGNMTIQRTQDCTPILEYTKKLHIEKEHGSSEMRHAAKIPFVILEKYCNDNNILFSELMQNKEHMKRILNDSSLSAFRIWPGRI